MKYNLRITFLILLLLPFGAKAGWLISGRYIDREGNTFLKRYFIQNNIVKVERYNLIYTCNLNTGSILLVDPENLVFARTNLKDYTKKLREIKLMRMYELLSLIPEDQRAEQERKYRAEIESELVLPVYNDDSLKMNILPDSSKLLGHFTDKYRVEEFGRMKEELFYTKDVNLSAEFDLGIFLQYVYLLEPEDKTVPYRASKKYMDKVKNGLVIRRFINEDGFRTEWQVNNYEKKTIPAYEFGIPALCKELTLDKWLTRSKQMEEKYYDDYE